nr:ribonuclease H-like domain-containing protein [Tanacetum cinerariifolium]
MSKEDKEKTAFYTNQVTYCYIKMLFILKNIRATYQRLVDSAFQAQLGQNIEAYVDDMVIKRKRSAERAMPFFETLKNITNENKDDYRWTKEAGHVFQEMKKLIIELPTLTTMDLKETVRIKGLHRVITAQLVLLVIMNGDAPASIASVRGSAEDVIPPKTTKQKIAKRNELKAKSTLLLAILDEHLLKFYGIKDANTLWEAIKTRFGSNKECKKMQKTILKQQYENFVASRSEGLDKTYDRKATVLYEYETFKATEGELFLDTYIRYLQVINDLKKCGYSKDNYELNFKFLNNPQPEWKQYATMIRHNKNLMDINIDALYNILKQNQGDVNDAIGLKKKTVVVTFDPLALIAEKTKVSKRKEKVVVSSDYEGSDADDFNELKKITALLAKAFNRRKFYSKPTNNNLRTSSTSQSTNKKQEFVKKDDKKVEKKDDEKKRDMSKVKCYICKKEGHFAKDCKKVKVEDYEYYKTKMLLAKKDKDELVLLAEDKAWMESSNDSDQEINANMVFMAQIEKVLSDSETSSSSAEDKISEVSYYLSKSETKSEYETSEYYDNTTTYGLFVNDNDDQENFHDCENFPKNLIESQINQNELAIDHNDSEGINKLLRKFNKNIDKCLKLAMSADSAVTYTSVHSEARSWSIPSEDPYEEAAQQLLEQAPHSPEYVPRDHVPVFVPEFDHPEDLVSVEGEAPTSLLSLRFLSPRIRPQSPRALEAEMNAIGLSLYHSLHPSRTPPWLPISTLSTSRKARIPEADTPPRSRPLLATPKLGCEVGESFTAAARWQGPKLVNRRVSYQVEVCTRESSEFCTRHHDAQKDRAAVRAEIEVLRNERLAYEQEGIQTRGALARSEAHCKALEA